jgi:hypothetical protein
MPGKGAAVEDVAVAVMRFLLEERLASVRLMHEINCYLIHHQMSVYSSLPMHRFTVLPLFQADHDTRPT